MATTLERKKNLIKIKQYITDDKGHKKAAIIEIKELNRLDKLLENLSDLKTIEDRKNEPDEDYETYGKKSLFS